ncbi:tripartite tricarboxylate transporter TctB family protein [Alkalihalobacillus oceani]|uniref:tripartite tricarboxylate transporter TctB family protein n=1 Tax=Halalkalibacter oceani TaxID=1653776 RepID=UPI002040492C|nr:tripartite tricarboxylate transporter TctB family protein [Halalkalibacter oceani]MCM3760284.1 tripartite tricarboxylate transporter TctB family protein [Halalkalibacter oceani]
MTRNQVMIPILLNLFILLLSLLFLILAITGLSPESASAPILVCSLTIIVAALAIVEDYRKKNKPVTVEEGEGVAEEAEESQKPMWFILALTLVYYLLIMYIGFFVSTVLFLLVIPYVYKFRNWKLIIISTISMLIIYWVGFSWLMNVRFPSGLLL